jgi:hypothetical protein
MWTASNEVGKKHEQGVSIQNLERGDHGLFAFERGKPQLKNLSHENKQHDRDLKRLHLNSKNKPTELLTCQPDRSNYIVKQYLRFSQQCY